MTTRLDYLTDLRDILEDADDTRWTDKARYVNLAARDIAKDTHCLEDWVTLSAVTGSTCKYTSSGLLVFKGSLQTGDRELVRVDLTKALCLYGESWETQTGDPFYYLFGPFGNKVFRVLLDPGAELADLKAWGVKLPATMANDVDVSELPAELDDAVGFRAAFHAYSRDFQQRNPEKAMHFRQLYQEEIDKFMAERGQDFDRSPRTIDRGYL